MLKKIQYFLVYYLVQSLTDVRGLLGLPIRMPPMKIFENALRRNIS